MSYRFWWLLASVPDRKQQPPEPVWHTPDAVCTVLDSWWWTERPSETRRVLFQNKINLRYCASSWFYYRNISRCTVLLTSNRIMLSTAWRFLVLGKQNLRPRKQRWMASSMQYECRVACFSVAIIFIRQVGHHRRSYALVSVYKYAKCPTKKRI